MNFNPLKMLLGRGSEEFCSSAKKANSSMDSQQIRDKYTGETVSQYEAKREESKKWHNEQDAVELLLNKAASDSGIQNCWISLLAQGGFSNCTRTLELRWWVRMFLKI